MKNLNFLLNLALIMGGGLPLLTSCTKDVELPSPSEMNAEAAVESMTATRVEDYRAVAVYDEEMGAWLRPQADPYALENVRAAAANLAAGEFKAAKAVQAVKTQSASLSKSSLSNTSVLSASVKAEFSAARIEATHYSVVFYPSSEQEDYDLRWKYDVATSYTPFDYVALPADDTDSWATAGARRAGFKQGRHTVTNEYRNTTDDAVTTQTLTMPALYAVWPCNKAFPAGADYEILYEIFLPTDNTKAIREVSPGVYSADPAVSEMSTSGAAKSARLSTDAMQALEAEALYLATGDTSLSRQIVASLSGESAASLSDTTADFSDTSSSEAANNSITRVPDGFVPPGAGFINISARIRLYMQGYYPPMANLRVRFQSGSKIWELTTNDEGKFIYNRPSSITDIIPDSAWFIVVYDNHLWKITNKNSELAKTHHVGKVSDLWPNNVKFVELHLRDGVCAIHCAANYFFYDSPDKISFRNPIRIEAHDGNAPESDSWTGSFHYDKYNNRFIRIYGCIRRNTDEILETTFHELGHYFHFQDLNGYDKMSRTHKFVKESYASCIECRLATFWYEYVNAFFLSPNDYEWWPMPNESHFPQYLERNLYSPVFIDLMDTRDQSYSFPDKLIDYVEGVPFQMIRAIANNCYLSSPTLVHTLNKLRAETLNRVPPSVTHPANITEYYQQYFDNIHLIQH